MIYVEHLSKNYGRHPAVEELSFHIGAHETVGFLGKNGAGKSTTMNMLTGFLAPTSGQIMIHGEDMAQDPERAKAHLGYLPEVPPLYPALTVEEYLRYACALKRVRRGRVKGHIDEVCEKTGLTQVRGRLIANLSKGYRQRVGLANALVGSPEIIILDEPSVGLDPQQMMEMRACIKSLRSEHTVMVSSHILSEIEQICTRVIIIDKGRMVAQRNLDHLDADDGILIYRLRVTGSAEQASEKLRALGIAAQSESQDSLELRLPTERRDELLIRTHAALAEMGCILLGMTEPENSLEKVFIRLTAGGEECADA